jgi:hypothetical protein
MPTEKKPSVRPARRQSAPKPVPEPAHSGDPAGLADVPPPLAYERTAAAAEDEGFDAITAAVFAAVVAVDVYCVAEANAKDQVPGLDALVYAADLAERALEADGAGDEQFTHLFAPRLPFDVLLQETGRATAADLFLARFEADLPKEAVRAVKALIRAEDTVARATWEGKKVTIEDLSTGRALPGPALWRRGTRPFVCRLVRVGSVHVPLAVERVEGRATVETLLEEVQVASVVARDVLKAGGLRLRSTKKGFGLGARLLAVPEES